MDIRKLQRAIVDGLEDVKGQDIQVFNTEHLSALFERVIVASGTSNRQTKALAAGVRDKVRERGFRVLSTEGADNGEWIIVDCGAAVVHIMQPAIREYYHLEEIWGDKPVRMKLGAVGSARLVKASEPMPPARDRDAASAPAKRRRSTDRADDAAGATSPAPAPRKAGARPATPPARKKTARQPAAVARRGLAQPTKLRSGAHRAAAGKGTAAKAPARKSTRGTR